MKIWTTSQGLRKNWTSDRDLRSGCSKQKGKTENDSTEYEGKNIRAWPTEKEENGMRIQTRVD
jgi:hypothetical protein